MYRIHYITDELGQEVSRVNERDYPEKSQSQIEWIASSFCREGQDRNRDYSVQIVEYWDDGDPVKPDIDVENLVWLPFSGARFNSRYYADPKFAYDVGEPIGWYLVTDELWLVPNMRHNGAADILNVGEPCGCWECWDRVIHVTSAKNLSQERKHVHGS